MITALLTVALLAAIGYAMLNRVAYGKLVVREREREAKVAELERAVQDGIETVERMRAERLKVSTIGARSAADNEFLNKVRRLAEDNDVRFVFDVVHRGIYEAILEAQTDDMVLNAAGKGKGVRTLEFVMENPEKLFGDTAR